MKNTKSVCTDEIFSVINSVEKKKTKLDLDSQNLHSSASEHQSDSQPEKSEQQGSEHDSPGDAQRSHPTDNVLMENKRLEDKEVEQLREVVNQPVNISLKLRDHIHRTCTEAAIDAATEFAETDPSIANPSV